MSFGTQIPQPTVEEITSLGMHASLAATQEHLIKVVVNFAYIVGNMGEPFARASYLQARAVIIRKQLLPTRTVAKIDTSFESLVMLSREEVPDVVRVKVDIDEALTLTTQLEWKISQHEAAGRQA